MEDQPVGRNPSIQAFNRKDQSYVQALQKDKDLDNLFLKLDHLSRKECVSLVNNYRNKCNDLLEKFTEKQRKVQSKKELSKNVKEAIQTLKDESEELTLDVKAKNAELNAYIEHRNLTKQYLDYLQQYKSDSEKILDDRTSKQQKQLNEIKAKIELFEQKLGLRILLHQDNAHIEFTIAANIAGQETNIDCKIMLARGKIAECVPNLEKPDKKEICARLKTEMAKNNPIIVTFDLLYFIRCKFVQKLQSQ